MTTTQPTIEEKIEAALADTGEEPGDQPVTEPQPRPTRRRRTVEPKVEEEHATEVKEPYALKAFTTRDVPWGQLGAILPNGGAVSAAKAAELGGLNFEVELLEAGFKSSVKPSGHSSPWKITGSRRAVVRKDTQAFFAYVSNDYAPIQFAEAFAFMDEIKPLYVAAGTTGGGKQAFMVVELPGATKVNLEIAGHEDPHKMYAILRTSHDLTRALEVSVMMLRDKCMNALTLSSFTNGAAQRWSVRHIGKDPMAKLQAARTTLARSKEYATTFEQVALDLSEIKLEIEGAKDLLKKILPDRPKREEQVNSIIHAWQESPTNGFRDNGWGLTNAVGEYFQWGRNEGTRTAQSRFTDGINGATHKYVNRTAQLLRRR